MMKRRTNLAGAGALLVSLLVSGSAFGQSVSDLTRDLDKIPATIDGLEADYLKPAVLASRYKSESRFNDGKVAYFLKDYQRASVLLVDLVSKENGSFLSYRESIYLLGDSLFRLRNYKSARRYFTQLIDLGPGVYFEEAAGRFLEMAFETRNFEGVDALVARLGSGSNGALSYISGKTLYRQDKFDAARTAFDRAASTPEYASISLYFKGVCFAAENRFGEAQQVFEQVVQKGGTNARDLEIVELSWLAQGRVAYEQGDFDRAIDMYARVPRESAHFDSSLWELTWVLVAKEMFREARRNVEILLLSDPDPAFVPEAKLLKADLSVRLDEYELAEEDYRDVLNSFEPIKKEMDVFISQQKDIQSFFGVLVQTELSGAEPDIMPPLVKAWVESDPTIRSAMQLIKDVRSISSDIDDTMSAVREINSRLESSTRVQSFPELAQGFARGVEAESQLLEIRRKMLDAQLPSVQGSMTPTESQEWEPLAVELEQLRLSFAEMPQTRDALAKREDAVFYEFDRLRGQIDAVGLQIDSLRAQVAGVDAYIKNDYGRPIKPDELTRINELRAEAKANITNLETIRVELQQEIAHTRDQIGMGDAVVLAEAKLRHKYSAALGRAERLLGNRGTDAAQITAARAKVPALQTRLDAYFNRMNELIGDKVKEVRETVRNEEVLLGEHRASLDEMVHAADGGAGVLAYLNFMRARAKFDELVLRGDVGLIDVGWQKKERMSNKINQLFEDRTGELRMLQDAFDEVR
jgi:tetratricopeptide (TPR) repeat protein/L-fucose mutarotase/ribose pyranase (RbsD/FucU family)